MTWTIINDLHLGVQRAGGTTPASFAALTFYTQCRLGDLLELADGTGLIINGDLFDGFTVPNATLHDTYKQLAAWLRKNDDCEMVLSRGNHDYHPSGDKVSSFDTLANILRLEYPEQVAWVTQPSQIEEGLVVVPHLPNQKAFDAAILDVIEEAPAVVLFHCNFDNNFAVEADHSLNLSRDHVSDLLGAGVKRIILGHEHQQRDTGGVTVVGNQFPTSISDCLGNSTKQLLRLDGLNIESVETWSDRGTYFECDWTKTAEVPEDVQFVRVKGEAQAEDASAVLEAVSQLRKRHKAFVVSNAVVVDGKSLDIAAADSFEAVEKFNVMEHLLPLLENEPQREWVAAAVKERRHEPA